MRKRFSFDPSFKMKNVNFTDDLFVKGLASRVPDEDLAKMIAKCSIYLT